MVNKKISELDPAATITGTETIPLLQAGATKAATVTQLLALVVASAPGNLDTFFEVATRIGLDEATVTTLQALVAAKADTATVAASYSPLYPGTPATSTAAIPAAGYPLASKAATLTGLAALLDDGAWSASMQILGDSTGAGSGNNRWPYLLGGLLAAKYPTYNVFQRLWNATTLKYDQAPQQIANGNPLRAVQLTGGSVTHPGDGTAITGDIDIRVLAAPTLWTGAAGTQTFAAHFAAAGQRCWRFQLDTAGKLRFDWTTDGTTIQSSRASTAAVPFANAAPGWVRVTFQVNSAGNNIATFYTAPADGTPFDDAVTWTQLGTPVSNAGATTLFHTTAAQYELGARTGASEPLTGNIYGVSIRNGIGGPRVVDELVDQWSRAGGTNQPAYTGAPTLVMVSGSHSGIALTQLSSQAVAMSPPCGQAAVIYSCSHNDAGSRDAIYMAQWQTLHQTMRNRFPLAAHAITGQNPRLAPATAWPEHVLRRQLFAQFAARNALSFIDVYRAFALSATPLGQLINADGIHPSDQGAGPGDYGSPLWARLVYSMILGRG